MTTAARRQPDMAQPATPAADAARPSSHRPAGRIGRAPARLLVEAAPTPAELVARMSDDEVEAMLLELLQESADD